MKMNNSWLIVLIILFTNCRSFNKKIDVDNHGVNLIWDFSNEKKYVYSLATSISSEFKTSKDSPLLKSTIVQSGNVLVKVKSNQLADFSITDLKSEYKWFKKDGTLKDSSSVIIPTTTIKDIGQNGVFGESETDMYFKLLMPLPSSKIHKGETYKVPLKFSLDDYPKLFNKGFNTITFAKIKTIQGRKCAVLNGLFDISNLSNIKELEGHYSQKITGVATYYFDIGKHCFLGVDINILENSLNNLKIQKSKLPGAYYMLSRYVIKIRLNGITDLLELS
ncbi:hypothetical protein [Tenacibaculum sp. nBUS_03]|uniref:hypothetical protein n=1 Tax=Tenacibaculum sp. nBUS_03 TaxID=3395320 RepID=UPI003EBB3C89